MKVSELLYKIGGEIDGEALLDSQQEVVFVTAAGAIFRPVAASSDGEVCIVNVELDPDSSQSKIEVLHSRDPDSECEVTVWVDGEIVGFDLEDVDPGRGHDLESWTARMHTTREQNPGRSPAFADAVDDTLQNWLESEYVR